MAALRNAMFIALALVVVACARADDEPPCLDISMDGIDVLKEPCKDPALACDHDNGCVGAMFGWLSKQYNPDEVNMTMYDPEKITPEWIVGCMAPHLETYVRTIPMATFMALSSCDVSGYLEQYPELRAYDFSSVSTSDFIQALPPGMLFRLLQAQRQQGSA